MKIGCLQVDEIDRRLTSRLKREFNQSENRLFTSSGSCRVPEWTAMTRTKWMRLGVRDPADILRWAGMQDARELDDFRYRVIRGREFVSFRMVPRYAIQIGTSDIIVVAHVKPSRRQRLLSGLSSLSQSAARRITAKIAAFKPASLLPIPVHTAELYQFALSRETATPRR
jgi:hypothetical protein